MNSVLARDSRRILQLCALLVAPACANVDAPDHGGTPLALTRREVLLTTDTPYGVALAAAPARASYLVLGAWGDRHDTRRSEARRLTSTGTVLDAAPLVTRHMRFAAYDGTLFVLAGDGDDAFGAEVRLWGQRMTLDGEWLDRSPVRGPASGDGERLLGLACGTIEPCAAVYSSFRETAEGYDANLFMGTIFPPAVGRSLTRTHSGPPWHYPYGVGDYGDAASDYEGSRPRFISTVTWAAALGPEAFYTYGWVASEDKDVHELEGPAIAAENGNQMAGDIACGSGGCTVVWIDDRPSAAGIHTSAGWHVPAAGLAAPPRIAWDGRRFVVVWKDDRGLLAKYLDATGQPVSADVLLTTRAPVAYDVASTATDRSLVAFAADGLRVQVLDGSPSCTRDAECPRGHCVDGVCCNTACGGGRADDCLACSVLTGAVSNGTCTVLASGEPCRPGRGACDVAERCDGTSAECPADSVQPMGIVCRPIRTYCDETEVCDGLGRHCPSDRLRPAGAPCHGQEDIAFCLQQICWGEPYCGGRPDEPASWRVAPYDACRPARNVCDATERCTRDLTDREPRCPEDQPRCPLGTTCEDGTCVLPDGGIIDAGPIDWMPDSGSSDAGPTDGGSVDSGTGDGGVVADSGALSRDAGAEPDGGSRFDAGSPAARLDAGPTLWPRGGGCSIASQADPHGLGVHWQLAVLTLVMLASRRWYAVYR